MPRRNGPRRQGRGRNRIGLAHCADALQRVVYVQLSKRIRTQHIYRDEDVLSAISFQSASWLGPHDAPCFHAGLSFQLVKSFSDITNLLGDIGTPCIQANGLRKAAAALETVCPQGILVLHLRAQQSVHFHPDGFITVHSLPMGLSLLDCFGGAAAFVYTPHHLFGVRPRAYDTGPLSD